MTQAFIKALPGVDAIPTRPGPRKVNHVIGAVHRALRFATRNDHASIDRMLLAFDLGKSDDYQAFLTIHFDALLSLREKWRTEDLPDFEQMLRSVELDLRSLGAMVTVPSITPAATVDSSHALGIAYVIRGSRMGAAVLRRDVAPGLSASYLAFVPTVSWMDFLIQLEGLAEDRSCIEEAIRAARGTFAIFATEFIRANRVIGKPSS
jgi:heme oxygenase (biliverdin-IX-beta and delta-forming)